MKKICVLGSTGSIGTQTLDIIRNNPEEFSAVSLTAGRNMELFRKQLEEFRPRYAAVAGMEDAMELAKDFPKTAFGFGMNGIVTAASIAPCDMVVNSLLGMMGIRPTYEAVRAGRDIAFANKETLVAAGSLIMSAVREKGVNFLPVDSEHSAIFQALQGAAGNPVKRILLTASGGPFRGYTYGQLKNVTLKQALKHPNWSMGAKITVDSATMMNKGLEIIEASWLFDTPAEKIKVLVHPESAVHSAVEFEDGSVIAQLGAPDMRLPIAYALSWPRRIKNAGKTLDLAALGTLHFEEPDPSVFRCLALAYRAIEAGGSYPCCMNAANEEAVAAFLAERIGFTQIADVVEACLDSHESVVLGSIDQVEELEKRVRARAAAVISAMEKGKEES